MSTILTDAPHGPVTGLADGEPAVAERKADRCVSCILPKSVSGLGFDQEGVCDICAAQVPAADTSSATTEPEGDIGAMLEKVRQLGKGRQYDCLVGLSGGRDSSYLLHLLAREHKLRCQAAYYRTPFTDDVIEENVNRIVDTLGVPLVRMNISQEFHRRFARKVMLLWKKRPLPALVNLLCAPCKYVNREAFRIARRNDIKSIIYGGNSFEAFQFGPAHAPARPGKHRHSFGSQLVRSMLIMKRGASLLAKFPGLVPLIPLGFKASVLYINPHTPYLQMRYPDILRCDYFAHAEYDEAECVDVITSKLGWRLPPGCHSYWRADCSIAEVKNLMFRQIVGASYLDTYLSNMVRSGVITRDEAFARLGSEGKVSEHRIEHVARALEVELDFLRV